MADDEQRRGNVVAKETKGETSTTVQSKARKARRKTLDTRAAAGMSVKPPPHILKEAMRKHFLFAATSSVVESEIDAVIAVMTPRRLADGEFLFGGDDAMAPDEGSSDTCWVLAEGRLRVKSASREETDSSPSSSSGEIILEPTGGCLINPLALVAAFASASGDGKPNGRTIFSDGESVLWGLQVDDFRRAVAATNLDRMTDRIEVHKIFLR